MSKNVVGFFYTLNCKAEVRLSFNFFLATNASSIVKKAERSFLSSSSMKEIFSISVLSTELTSLNIIGSKKLTHRNAEGFGDRR